MPDHRILRRVRAMYRPSASPADDGFTIVELAVAIGLIGFVFAAVAAVMMGGMRTLAVTKARTQGNEVATQAIEDLQRFGYSSLGLCSEPASPPSGLTETVLLEGGCSGAVAENSCTSPAGTAISSLYTCVRNNITYEVKRYIAWSNPEHTAKRLAVFVKWTDSVGEHTVSQQSSVRAPGVADIVGLKPPTLTNPTITAPSQVTITAGKLATGTQIDFQITSANMSSADQVAVVYSALDNYGVPYSESLFLSPLGETGTWKGSLKATDNITFGAGTQYVSFRAIRAKDGKQTAAFATTPLTFCDSATGCNTATAPTVTPTVPGSVQIYPSGAIKNNFTVTATTKNLTSADKLSVAFMTQNGMLALGMQIDTTVPCTTTSCTWTATVTPTNGYAFSAGSQYFYFTAEQVKSSDPTSVDQGNTVAVKSASPVSFTS